MTTLERLARLVREQGGLLASLVPAGAPAPLEHGPQLRPAELLAEGPRVQAQRERYELLIDAIYEGYLLHYGQPRILDCPQDDLRLLAGDRLYALGLAQIVALGDVLAVTELSDLITIAAQAQEAGEADLAEASWSACVRAIGHGVDDRHRHAKQLALGRARGALEAMRTSAAG